MFRTSRLTREQKAQVAELNVRPESLIYPLMGSGCDADTAIAIARARGQSSLGFSMHSDDIRLMDDLADPGLLLAIVEAGYNVYELRFALMREAITVDAVREAVAVGVDPSAVVGWVTAGRAVPDLAAPLAALPHVDPAAVVTALILGATVDDIAWLACTPRGARSDALNELRISIDSDPAVAMQLAGMDTPRRRLVLALAYRDDFPLAASLALAVALDDAPWIDTLTTLILDGAPVYEAVALARADQRIEQQRTVTLPAGSPHAAGRDVTDRT